MSNREATLNCNLHIDAKAFLKSQIWSKFGSQAKTKSIKNVIFGLKENQCKIKLIVNCHYLSSDVYLSQFNANKLVQFLT